jgi:ATP-binding cassette, subfamily B, bacterial
MKRKIQSLVKKLNFKASIQLTWSVSKPLTSITLFFLVLENILWLSSIYMLKALIDIVAKPGYVDRKEELIYAIGVAGIISVTYACVKSLSSYFSELQSAKVNHYVDKVIHEHTLKLDYSNFESPEYLDILKRAREAGIDKPYAVVSSLFDIVKNSIMMASVGYLLISIDWMLLPLLAIFVLPILISRILFSNKGFAMYMRNTGLEREAHYLSSLITADVNAKEMRTFLLRDFILPKYISIKDNLMEQGLKLSKKRTFNELLTTGVGTTAFFGVTAYIVFGTLSGKTSVGDIAVFLVIFPQSYAIMQTLVAAIAKLYQNNMFVTHIFELLNLVPDIENRTSAVPNYENEHTGELKIENVYFKYPHSQFNALEDVSLHIPPGKIVALVGTNGSGKTTLIKLLCKLYEPTSGKIIFRGNDIAQYSAEEYRKHIGVVFQDFVKYNLTVAENIWLGDINKQLNHAAIKKAASNAGVDAFVESLPDQYETILGRLFDNGHEVSIGQWQKIAIARAFYSDSNLIILDEATSALDAIAETELFRSLRVRLQKRSALVISHRLSTIKHADYIYVMANKRIVESGTHDELIALKGQYASLYEANKEE